MVSMVVLGFRGELVMPIRGVFWDDDDIGGG